MKKFFWIIGLSIGILLLAGCGKQAQEAVQPSASPAAQSETSAPPEGSPQAEVPQEHVNITEHEQAMPQQEPTQKPAVPANAPAQGQKTENQQSAPQQEPPQAPAPVAQQPQEPVVQPPQEAMVYLSVEIPCDGTTVITRTAAALQEGDTAYTVLRRVAKDAGIPVVASGGGKNPYVEGINNLFEFDRGAGSGWMVSVNGTFIQRSSGQVKLSAGDEVRWQYTLELGKDIGGGI